MKPIIGKLNSTYQINVTQITRKATPGVINSTLRKLVILGAKKSPFVSRGCVDYAILG